MYWQLVIEYVCSGSTAKTRYYLMRGKTDDDTSKRPVISSPLSDSKWLQRYGEGVSEDIAHEMLRIWDDLLSMEKQVDIDKQLIKSKLLKACESCRDVEDSYKDSVEDMMFKTA